MPSVSSLTHAASNWIEIRENARAEFRLGSQAKRQRDKEAIVDDLTCAEEQLRASQRKVADQMLFSQSTVSHNWILWDVSVIWGKHHPHPFSVAMSSRTRKPSCRWRTRATLAKSSHGLRKSSVVVSCIARLPIDSLPMVSYYGLYSNCL